MERKKLLQKIKYKIIKDYPSAKITLYGSRARGDYQADSDWDLLILIDKEITEKQKFALRHKLYDIEWDVDEVICSIIHSKKEWAKLRITPFYKNVQKDGIEL